MIEKKNENASFEYRWYIALLSGRKCTAWEIQYEETKAFFTLYFNAYGQFSDISAGRITVSQHSINAHNMEI